MNAPATTPDGATRAKSAHLWERHPEDFYIEPPWCSERLFETEKFEGGILDPACGSGRIVAAAEAAGLDAAGSDLVDRCNGGYMHALDFLDGEAPFPEMLSEIGGDWRNVVCNPPFKHADAFVRRALAITPGKVAMLLPAGWMNGEKRGAWLEETPLRTVWLISPRPSMPPGPVVAAGIKPGNGRTDYAWYVWERGYLGRPTLRWLRRDVDA